MSEHKLIKHPSRSFKNVRKGLRKKDAGKTALYVFVIAFVTTAIALWLQFVIPPQDYVTVQLLYLVVGCLMLAPEFGIVVESWVKAGSETPLGLFQYPVPAKSTSRYVGVTLPVPVGPPRRTLSSTF